MITHNLGKPLGPLGFLADKRCAAFCSRPDRRIRAHSRLPFGGKPPRADVPVTSAMPMAGLVRPHLSSSESTTPARWPRLATSPPTCARWARCRQPATWIKTPATGANSSPATTTPAPCSRPEISPKISACWTAPRMIPEDIEMDVKRFVNKPDSRVYVAAGRTIVQTSEVAWHRSHKVSDLLCRQQL
jgi:hypothetical protein